MPAGAHWTLRYDATIDGRIQARDHAHHLRLDEFVQHVDLTRDRHGEITLGVQFYEDRERPYDENLTKEVQRYQVVPREPEPEPGPPRSIQQLIEDFVNTPITRVRFGQAVAAPIRNRLDYVSTARRSILVLDPPYDFRVHHPLDNALLGDAVHHPLPLSQESLHTALDDPTQVGRLFAERLQVPQQLLQSPVPVDPLPTMADVPTWLKAGVWVKSNSKDSFAQVLEIEDNVMINGPFVCIKHWRSSSVGLPLRLFLTNWTQCEKPAEPLSRYERIIKGI
jgi:hypothetical protein